MHLDKEELENMPQGTDVFSLCGTYLMHPETATPEGTTAEEEITKFAIQVNASGEKKLKKDDKTYNKVSDHIGTLPIVMVSPSDITLVSDSGDQRRKFMNSVLSQMDRDYLSAAQQYNRLLAQRNTLLKGQSPDTALLSVIDARMAAPAIPSVPAMSKALPIVPLWAKSSRVSIFCLMYSASMIEYGDGMLLTYSLDRRMSST